MTEPTPDPLESLSIGYCPRCGTRVAAVERFGSVRPVCPKCDYVHFDDPKVAAVVWLERQTADGPEVLLVQRDGDPGRGLWALPAGFIDRGEEPRAAARREVLEETGLMVAVGPVIEVFLTGIVVTIVFAGELVGGTLAAADDAADARWYGPAALPPMDNLAFESTRQLVTAWLARLAQVAPPNPPQA